MIRILIFSALILVGYAGLISDNPAAALLVGKNMEQNQQQQPITPGSTSEETEKLQPGKMVGTAAVASKLWNQLDGHLQDFVLMGMVKNLMQPTMTTRSRPQGYNDYATAMLMMENPQMMQNPMAMGSMMGNSDMSKMWAANNLLQSTGNPMMMNNPYMMKQFADNMNGDTAENMMMMNMFSNPMMNMNQPQPMMNMNQPPMMRNAMRQNQYMNNMMNAWGMGNMMNGMMNQPPTSQFNFNNPMAMGYGGMDQDTATMLYMMQELEKQQQGQNQGQPAQNGLSPEEMYFLSQGGDNAANFFFAEQQQQQQQSQPGMPSGAASMFADPYLLSNMDSSDLLMYQMLENFGGNQKPKQKL